MYEYEMFHGLLSQAALNSFGSDGWKLIQILPSSDPVTIENGFGKQSACFYYFFGRELPGSCNE